MQYNKFPVTIYSILKPISPVMSMARCRIFYKGLNRNGSYITDKFAEKLIQTLPYVPIKGIYDKDEEDFSDHGEKRDEGRIYGIVPEKNNFAWEEHIDKDGVKRTYACVDVYLYTALYKEASKILNKGESMEIYPPTIKGEWKKINGQRAFAYDDGCFLGLQVLGDKTEPCFEGSAFFSLYKDMQALMSELEKVNTFANKKEDIKVMYTFKLSDAQKNNALWALLNTNYNEENNWLVDVHICDVYDKYAVVYEYESGSFYRVYYTKDDENDTVTIDSKEQCFIVDVNEEEKTALNALQAIKGTYSSSLEEFNTIKHNYEVLDKASKEDKENFESKISELEEQNTTLETEKTEFSSKVDTLTAEVEALRNYKTTIENDTKKSILESYSAQLSEDIISEFSEKIEDYSIEDLKKELAYTLVGDDPTNFSKQSTPRAPKTSEPSAFEKLLDKYKKD